MTKNEIIKSLHPLEIQVLLKFRENEAISFERAVERLSFNSGQYNRSMAWLLSKHLIQENKREIDLIVTLIEIMYHYLGSKENIIDKIGIDDEEVVEIANPKSQRYRMIRNSIIPNLLHSEAVSAHALYPHKIFEIGCVVQKENKDYLPTSTKHYAGLLRADNVAGFNEINEDVSALLFYLNVEYTLKAVQDRRFIQCRSAAIMINNQQWGILGELNPEVLENWHIEMPCAAAEIDISALVCFR